MRALVIADTRGSPSCAPCRPSALPSDRSPLLLRCGAHPCRRRSSGWRISAPCCCCRPTAPVTLAFVKGAWERLLGWEPEDLTGLIASDLVHPADRPELRRALQHARGARQGLSGVELRTATRDGRWRSISWQMRFDQGRWYGAGQDMGENSRAAGVRSPPARAASARWSSRCRRSSTPRASAPTPPGSTSARRSRPCSATRPTSGWRATRSGTRRSTPTTATACWRRRPRSPSPAASCAANTACAVATASGSGFATTRPRSSARTARCSSRACCSTSPRPSAPSRQRATSTSRSRRSSTTRRS